MTHTPSRGVRVADLRPDESDPTILRGTLGKAEVRVLVHLGAKAGDPTHFLYVAPTETTDHDDPPA